MTRILELMPNDFHPHFKDEELAELLARNVNSGLFPEALRSDLETLSSNFHLRERFLPRQLRDNRNATNKIMVSDCLIVFFGFLKTDRILSFLI